MISKRRIIYLVRHGATPHNQEGRICGHLPIGLGPEGEAQAEDAAALLAEQPLELILTSPLRRTVETAEILARGRDLEPEPHEGLIELDLGRWQGQTFEELREDELWRTWRRAPHTIATPGGERLEDVSRRARAAVAEGLARLPDRGGLVVVTHGGVLKVLLLGLLGMPLSTYQQVRVQTGSVSAVEVSAELELRLVLGINLTSPCRAFARTS